MNKKTNLLSIISVFLLITISSCGHTHEFSSSLKYNESAHWNECECGEKSNIESHEYGDYIYDSQEHWKQCKCGNITAKSAHNLGEYIYDSTYHWKQCECGYTTTKENHIYEHGEDSYCAICGRSRGAVSSKKVANYLPTSVTVTMRETSHEGYITYGFTWNSTLQSSEQVIQIAKGNIESFANFLTSFSEVIPTSYTYNTYNSNTELIDLFVYKAEIELDVDTTYTYRVYDKKVGSSTDLTTFKTVNPQKNSFKFAHLTDTQSREITGYLNEEYVRRAMKSCLDDGSEFILHTGDMVESSQYEDYWKRTLDGIKEYYSTTPVQVVSGNHETTHKCGTFETIKHFNPKIPEQDTQQGFYYSFTYANAKFIMLNTNETTTDALQQQQYYWLVNELKNNNKQWLIVGMHCPVYSSSNYGSKPENKQQSDALKDQLTELFYQYKVDLVLQGHDHTVQRTYPMTSTNLWTEENYQIIDDVEYIVNPKGAIYTMPGSSGSQQRGPYSEADLSIYKYAQTAGGDSSYADIEIVNNKLTYTQIAYNYKGEKITNFKWGIIKN